MKKPTNRWVTRYKLLNQFFRAYLHQDFPEEYGSVAGALRQYRKDAGEADFRTFAAEWSEFVSEVRDFPSDEVRRVLLEDFGASWTLTSRHELDVFTEAMKKSA